MPFTAGIARQLMLRHGFTVLDDSRIKASGNLVIQCKTNDFFAIDNYRIDFYESP